MALVSSSFAERYAELTARVPTLTDRLLDVQRRELYGRREVEAQAQAAFQDLLHVTAIMIADKKARKQGSNALMDTHALALHKQETAVWFPAAPPRAVPFRANRPLRAFPHAAFAEICDEERELRQWLYGVERRLRQHIEEAGSRSWFYLSVMDETVATEHRTRQRLLKDEDEVYTALKQRFFRTVPAEYFRHVVVTRYGATVPALTEEQLDTSVEGQEGRARRALCDAETQGRKGVFQYLQTAYDVRLFALNHREVMERYELEQTEANELYPLMAGLCRTDFGGTFYHLPAVALHLGANCACLRALCLSQLQRREPAAEKTGAHVPEAETATKDAKEEHEMTKSRGEQEEELEEEKRDEAEVEDAQSAHRPSTNASHAETMPGVEATRTAALTPSSEIGVEENAEAGLTDEPVRPKNKEWEVNSDPTAAVRVTLYAYQDSQPALYATDEMEPVLLAQEEEAPRGSAPALVADVVEALSHNNSELTCTPQPLAQSLFSHEEIFIGDPFAETLQKGKKEKKAKKAKKSSKSKKTK